MSVLDILLDDIYSAFKKFRTGGNLDELLSELKQELHEAVEQALKNNNIKQLFLLIKTAFKSTQANAEQLFPKIWDQLFKQRISNSTDIVDLIYQLSDELSDVSFVTLLETLLQTDQDHLQMIRQAAIFCLSVPGETRKRLSHLWGPLLSATLKWLGPEKMAEALRSVITSDELELKRHLNFLDLFPDKSENPIIQKLLALAHYQLPAGVMLASLGLQSMIQKTVTTDVLLTPEASTKTFLDLFEPILNAIKDTSFKYPAELEYLSVVQVFVELIKQAKGDEEAEWALLKMARFFPIGIFLIIGAILYCLTTYPLPWWKLLFNEIENDPDLKVRRLPAPAVAGPKYFIFSDIHRDARSDKRDPLEFGSIDHFAANQTLYCEILDYAIDNGFTVIEAGDCDELWYFRDFSMRPREKLVEIINTHKPVFDRLVKLHKENRYFRLYGNHDDSVRNPQVFEVLQDIFDPDPKPDTEPFAIYDFAIIDDVKSMDESILNFGLDSEPYQIKVPMIIAHGHQWDFWNCDQNNIIGKLIVSTIATPIDFLDDPFVDAGGIAYAGSPVINFPDILAKAFILNNFPAQLPARKFAHKIQHLDDFERGTIDDIFFLESLAALSGSTIAVRKQGASTETRRKNLLCLGHTHYPQSQPYFNLKKILPFIRNWIEALESKITELTKGLIKPNLSLVKSRYFNSGTVGWMEGIVWAIQIDESGQARLVFWTQDTRPAKPQTMDWELPLMEEALRTKLETKKGSFLNTIENLSTLIDPLIDSAVSSIIRSLAIPFEELLTLFKKIPPADVKMDPSQTLQDPLSHIFLSLLGSEEPKIHTIQIAMPASICSYLKQVENLLEQMPQVSQENRFRLACAWLLATQNIPQLSRSQNRVRALTRGMPDYDLVIKTVLGLIVQLPGEKYRQFPIRSQLSLEGNTLTIQIITHPKAASEIATQQRGLSPRNDYLAGIHYLCQHVIRLPDSMIFK